MKKPKRASGGRFRFSWQLDAILFWAIFSASAIFILWLFNNTIKAQIRSSVEQRISNTTRVVALLLDPKLHFPSDVFDFQSYLNRIQPSIVALKSEHPDVLDIVLGNFDGDNLQLFRTSGKSEPLQNKESLFPLVKEAQESKILTFSEWNFLRNEIFFFFTPKAQEQEFSALMIPNWDHLPYAERPVAIIVFNAAKIRSELATVDVNSANVIAVAILWATALSVMMRRRSRQREEAIAERLAALRMLRQRDSILAATVTAADQFIMERDLANPIVFLLRETSHVVHAEAAYFFPLPHAYQRALGKPIGVWPEGFEIFDLNKFLKSPDGKSWKEKLDQGHAIASIVNLLPHEEQVALKRMKIQSIAILPVISNHRLVAALVLENRQQNIDWEMGLITTLKLAANLLGSAIARQENEIKLIQSSKMEALGRMASGVAHEFNNLLHIVAGNLAALANRFKDEENSVIENIRQAAHRGSTIIDQLLRATRQSEVNFQSVALNDVVARTVALMKPALSKSIELSVDLDEELPSAPMDESLIQQVMLNIVLNAQYAVGEKGQITITTGKSGKIKGRQEYIYCSIRDNGPGISQEIIDSIFNPFFTTKPPGTGTGLGLFTSRGILEQHRGMIEAANHPEGGAVFTFYLPVRKITGRKTQAIQTPLVAELPKEQTVLVADDEPLCLALAEDILKEQGFKILAARDGNEILLQAQTHKDHIDWIITDWTMPGVSGEMLVRQLKEILPKTKLIVTSGFFIEANEHIDAIVRKPFQSDDLIHAMKKTLASLSSRET
ncbi:MAG: hybrid sensor histidine kinase/response regulator [Verrucomicrobiota bacterium]